MQYDKSGPSSGAPSGQPVPSRRRLLLGGAAVLGTAGVWALADGALSPSGDPQAPRAPQAPHASTSPRHAQGGPAAPAGRTGAGGAARGARPMAPRAQGYRSRPSLSGAGAARAAPGLRPPAVVRHGAHFTLGGRPAGRGSAARRIALTFDDGPDPVYTPAILKVLRRHGVHATFFVLGQCGDAYPHLVKQVAHEGHVVANHTWRHPELPRLRYARVRDELARTCELILRCTGAPPQFARAPYGAWDRASLRICADLGMEPVGWSVDTSDWARPGVPVIESRVLTNVDADAIVLSHDGGGNRAQSVKALSFYLPRLLDQGYEIVPVAFEAA